MKVGYLVQKLRAKAPARIAFAVLVIVAIPVIVWAQWTTSSNDIYNSNSGWVGVGTSAPDHTLTVVSGTAADWALKIRNTASNGVSGFGYYDNSDTWKGYVGYYNGTPNLLHLYGASGVGISLYTNTTEAVRVTSGGNVGIGTTSPSSKLDVNGDITVAGNISAKYQDIAEWVPARHPIPPGTVVILDLDATNSVVPSVGAYDTHVAGVVSPKPGLVLGEAGKGKVKVATMGRVKVRVDATVAPIGIGDLLVTSDREGLAMRSEPIDMAGVKIHRPGSLIGKALEPLAEGEGEILVLLSLQ